MFLLTAKKKFIRNLTILTLIISALTVLIFELFFPERYFVCYPCIPIFFYLFGVFFINVSLFIYRNDEKKLMPVLLIFRGLKMFLSLIAVVACGYIARHHVMSFGLIIAAYYLIYLVFEACFFFQLEIEMKNKE